MSSKVSRTLKFIPMCLVMVVIFAFSAMEGDDSSQASGLFLNAIKKLAEEMGSSGFSAEALASIHLIIRKCAHFTEYGVLGASAMFALVKRGEKLKKFIITSEAICFLYAVTDEIHQYFVPGRYGTPMDLLIDSVGAIVGILIYFLAIR